MEKVRVSLGFTCNIGNFENIRTDIDWEGDVRSGENHNDATNRLYNELEEKLVEKARELYETMTEDARQNTQIHPAKSR